MRTLIVLAAFVAATCAVQISEQLVKQQWQSFKTTHNKVYKSPVEEEYRMKIFKENLIKITKHNERYEQGLETYTMGVNHLADLHGHEIAERNGLRVPKDKIKAAKPANLKWPWDWDDDDDDDDDSSSLDYRTKGYVGEVKDQGQCGSCWSFSSTGALEGQFAKKTGKLPSLSEQNLIDCSWDYGNQGCNGGLMTSSFEYVADNKGIDTEASYPYTEMDSYTCKYSTKFNAGSISSYAEVNPTEKDLKAALDKVGPISVGIQADLPGFSYYTGGIYYDRQCTEAGLDHGVLLVGYGTENGQDYWLVKNSWGTYWGLDGYIKMARNKNNHCGIASMASYPIV